MWPFLVFQMILWLKLSVLIILNSGMNPSIPKKISEENIVDVAEVNQLCCLEKSGQWLEIVDRTYLYYWLVASKQKIY